jgi:hypothetical protein
MPSQAASLRPKNQQLIAAQVLATSGASAVFELPNDLVEVVLVLEIVAASGTTPTIDAVLQTALDDLATKFASTGNKWTQLTTTGQMRAIAFSRQRHAGQAAAEYDATQVTGAATSANGPVSRKCRVFFTVGGTGPSFTVNLWLIANPPATV